MPSDELDPTALPDEQDTASTESAWGPFLEFAKTIAFVVIVAFLIRQFLVKPFIVEGASMEPNFHNNEYILVDKLSYRLHQPQRGDVVVFNPPGETDFFIKRVIGLPGDQVTIQGEDVFVNGQQLTEPYLDETNLKALAIPGNSLERLVGDDEFFVLGDNRDHSKDSREIGPIPRERIVGRAWLVLLPIDQLEIVTAPNYALDTNRSNKPELVNDLFTPQHG